MSKTITQWRHNSWIELEGVDISKHVISVDWEDCCAEETDSLTVVIDDPDRKFMKRGPNLKGLEIKLLSGQGRICLFAGKVQEPSFSGKRGASQATLSALTFQSVKDYWYTTLKEENAIVLRNVTISDVMKMICSQHVQDGYDYLIENTGIIYPNFMFNRSGLTDWQVINELAVMAGGMEVMMKNHPISGRPAVIVRRRKPNIDPILKIGPQDIIDYSIVDASGDAENAAVLEVNEQQEMIEIYNLTSDAARYKDSFKTNMENFANNPQAKGIGYTTLERVSKNSDDMLFDSIYFPVVETNNGMSFGEFLDSAMANKASYDRTLTITVTGDERIRAGTTIYLGADFGDYDGKYYISPKVTHKFSRSGTYQCTLQLSNHLGNTNADGTPVAPDYDEEGLSPLGILGSFGRAALGLNGLEAAADFFTSEG